MKKDDHFIKALKKKHLNIFQLIIARVQEYQLVQSQIN